MQREWRKRLAPTAALGTGTINWTRVVDTKLEPWAEGGISETSLDLAGRAIQLISPDVEADFGQAIRLGRNGSQLLAGLPMIPFVRLVPHAWRAQILGGRLHMVILRAQHATIDVNLGPKLLLLDTLREHPSLPDVDIRIAAATRTLGCPQHSTDEHSGPCGDSRVAVRQPDGGGPAQLQVGPKKLLAGDRRRVAPRSPAALLAVHRA